VAVQEREIFCKAKQNIHDSGTSPLGLTERVNLNVHNKQLHYVTNGTMNLLPQARKVGLSGFI